MNENSFTYNGTTVNFTEAQKAIILADQNLITQLNNQKNALTTRYGQLEGTIAEARAKLDNYCNNLSNYGLPTLQNPNPYTGAKDKCIEQWNSIWTSARNEADNVANVEIPIKTTQINSAIKKLNDDLTTIQNDIKLQIQTQQANTAAASAAAGNQATIINAPANAAAANEQALLDLKNQAEAAKLKQEQTIKIFGFVLLAVVVIVVAVLLIRKA